MHSSFFIMRLQFFAVLRSASLLSAVVLFPITLCAAQPAETDAEVWGGLVYAFEAGDDTEAGSGEAAVISLGREAEDDLRMRLSKVFTGKAFHVLGEHDQGVFKQYESWLVPSRELFIKLDSKGPAAGGGVLLGLQLWRNKDVIMKTDVVLVPGSPLFIEGPRWRQGNLVFVVLLK